MKLENVYVNSIWIGKVKSKALLEAISTLSPDAQLALNFKFWGGLKNSQIARRLMMTEESVPKVLSAALKTLREKMRKTNLKTVGSAA